MSDAVDTISGELAARDQGGEQFVARPVDFKIFSDSADGRATNLGARMAEYDPASPEAAHLRPHQVEAVQRFRDVSRAILSRDMPNEGMAILHPTGSGKTVTTSEIIRMVSDDLGASGLASENALVLVPGHQIMSQTTGNDDEVGAIRSFAPNLTVAEYSGRRKSTDAHVTVMTYQALTGAIDRGDIDAINPGLIVCDEAHHIIDGTWAQAVQEISEDRLLLGLTATPSYSETRNVKRLFPRVLAEKTMKEGVEEGVLCEMQGFVYKGSARISISRSRRGGDYAEEDMFAAIANSPDNYLAAKIVAQEVRMGRRGVVSCVPGYDRAHAKIVAEILSQTLVETPDGERKIRAAFVGGETSEGELERIFADYKAGRLDVLTYVNLLLEGWDSPQSDFTVLLRPTLSKVLAEQRVGRILRPREGKIATVHEFMYEVDDGILPDQITHLDILNRDRVVQGYRYGYGSEEGKPTKPWKKYNQDRPKSFTVQDYSFDPDLAAKIKELEAVPLEEIRILCGQEVVPIEWNTSHMLSNKFGMDRTEIEEVLKAAGVPSRSEVSEGVTRVYYPPRAVQAVAEHLGLALLPDEYLTASELQHYHRNSQQFRRISRKMIEHALEDEGIAAGLYVRSDGSVITAYPPESKDVIPVSTRGAEPRGPRRESQPKAPEPEAKVTAYDVYDWLDEILVNPDLAPTLYRRTEIRSAQSALLASIQTLDRVDKTLMKKLRREFRKPNFEPTTQMNNVMEAKKLDIVALLIAARRAQASIKKSSAKQRGY